MRAVTVLAVLAFLVGLAVPAAQATAPKAYFETLVAQDKDGDYASNGALDITAVYLGERYTYDQGNATGYDSVEFRLDLRNPKEFETFEGQVPFDYLVGFKANGKDMTVEANLTQTCSPGSPTANPIVCTAPTMPKPHHTAGDGGVVLKLNRALAGLPVGTAITDVYAASATVTNGQKVWQDVVPMDNANQPAGPTLTPPATKGPGAVLKGTYPFLTGVLKSPATQFAVTGGQVGFVVGFRTDDNAKNLDHVWFKYAAPVGWTVEGNLGNDFITTAGGQKIEYEFTVKAPPAAAKGTTVDVVMDAALEGAGGHVVVPVKVQVTGARVEDPSYAFDLTTKGPFKAERQSTLAWKVLHDGAPLANFQAKADFVLNSRTVDSLDVKGGSDGVYKVNYSFPQGGTWTVDLFVSELQPSPHHVATVEVKAADGGILPGVGALGAVLAFAVALAGVRSARRPL